MQDIRKLSDADTAVYLRNAALALAEIAQAKGIRISITAAPDRYVDVMFGDYEYVNFPDRQREWYDYAPCYDGHPDWRRNIRPGQVNLAGGPKETAPAGRAG